MKHLDGGAEESRASRLPIVGVMGSGTEGHDDRAGALGRCLAEMGVHLLTGGGGGVMEAVSKAFSSVTDRVGKTIGVIPGSVDGSTYDPLPGYPNPWVEITIFTHLPLSGTCGTDQASRNHINILTADVVVALPGSHGTASEVRLALRYEKPLVVFAPSREAIPGLPAEASTTADIEEVKLFVQRTIESLRK